jgi:hypothetical protein
MDLGKIGQSALGEFNAQGTNDRIFKLVSLIDNELVMRREKGPTCLDVCPVQVSVHHHNFGILGSGTSLF